MFSWLLFLVLVKCGSSELTNITAGSGNGGKIPEDRVISYLTVPTDRNWIAVTAQKVADEASSTGEPGETFIEVADISLQPTTEETVSTVTKTTSDGTKIEMSTDEQGKTGAKSNEVTDISLQRRTDETVPAGQKPTSNGTENKSSSIENPGITYAFTEVTDTSLQPTTKEILTTFSAETVPIDQNWIVGTVPNVFSDGASNKMTSTEEAITTGAFTEITEESLQPMTEEMSTALTDETDIFSTAATKIAVDSSNPQLQEVFSTKDYLLTTTELLWTPNAPAETDVNLGSELTGDEGGNIAGKREIATSGYGRNSLENTTDENSTERSSTGNAESVEDADSIETKELIEGEFGNNSTEVNLQDTPDYLSTEVNATTRPEEQATEESTTDDYEDLSPTEVSAVGILKEKFIDSGSGSKKQELEEKPVVWNGPTVKTQSVKTKANWTTTVLNGEAVYTDISVYQSHGVSYVFRIPGGLPEDMPGGIIAWIRANNHKYPHTDISYKEFGSDVVESLAPPTELPLRCGTKFLEKLSGGKATPIEDNPWQVAVLRRDTEAYVCGGAVITRRHVLSAAHCFKRKNQKYSPKHILLRVGDYDKEVREESQVDYSVTELAIHERYHEKRHLHDIALLTTSGDIPFSSHVYPICLPPPWAHYTAGIRCTVSGWGQVGINEETTRYLRSGQVAIVSHEECRKKTIFSKGVPPEIFCAEDPTKQGVDTCLGDSGGPFACSLNGTFYLYGITAFGSYPCGQDIPSFYTNVSFYKLWILHVLDRKADNATATK